ncbi:hypothetical protein ElyMa_000816700 [Elysia marginata]|uniref:Kinesin motor domain-containing protein n=1 Tax=Elysia marginata TaxID=1093978 RepID=A0AAV4GYQ8_9GAST|nr:hypothetical protein ElyMa_000816700 [Elysia marginata]
MFLKDIVTPRVSRDPVGINKDSAVSIKLEVFESSSHSADEEDHVSYRLASDDLCAREPFEMDVATSPHSTPQQQLESRSSNTFRAE